MLKNQGQYFFGVVEDRMDPLYLGRVRVRVFNLHPFTKVRSDISGIATDDLLWMEVMQPVTSSAISGIGHSPTNLLPGTHVVVVFKDEYFQDGLVIGTYAGQYTKKPDTNYGFCDPNGEYPRYIGNDVNTLARAGRESELQPAEDAEVPVTVENQDLNVSDAPEPDNTPIDEIPEVTDPGSFTLEQMLINDEGIRVNVYWDTEGYPTIGIGHLIIHERTKNMTRINEVLSQHVGRTVGNSRITQEECSALFAKDVSTVRTEIRKSAKVYAVYSQLDNIRQMAIENMCFQMGVGGVSDFNKALAYMALKRWNDAHRELLDSAWARQTPGRANRVARVIQFGNLVSYGVPVTGAPTRRRVRRSIVMEPAPRSQSSGKLFSEPKSSYAAQYPYNHVYESESGHIQEFDDTPGHARYHRLHPSGTFIEVHPDGTRVTKIVGEDFVIAQSGRNVKVSGNLNVVVEGNCTQYIMGNVSQTVDGSMTQFVRGNVTETVEGSVNSQVNGNVTELVKGNVNSTVNGDVTYQVDGNVKGTVGGNADLTIVGNCNTEVQGDYMLKVGGNYTSEISGTRTDSVQGSWSRQADTVTDNANGQFNIDGSRINIG